MEEEASWDSFFEYTQLKPLLVLYENFAADYERSTFNLLERLGLDVPSGLDLEPRLKRQSDSVNDDWTRRFAELRLGTQFDLVPTPAPVLDHAEEHA
jgi:LPS sulfotransferase NodH